MTSQPTGFGQLRALIIDDNEHMRILLRTVIHAIGVRQITEYSDGTDALGNLATTQPDFILCDFSMAPMDGLELTKAVRRLPDRYVCVTPIIMITGHTERRRVQLARDAGVTEILAKPITTAGLLHRIEEIINRPRPFVKSPNYCGPCRRRHRKEGFNGPWRRKTDADAGHTVEVDVTPPVAVAS